MIAPLPSQNQLDSASVVSDNSLAKRIWDQHRRAARARRQLELIWEMLLLHIDGGGDAQWATIYEGTRVEIPRFLSEYRKTENVLRPIVRNAVAYHTTVPLRYFAESSADQRSRERAIIDTLWANHLCYEQDFNGLFAQAMSLAMATGFCFDSETEVLTEAGFKFFKDVDIEVDRIASLDPATGKLTYAKAIAKQEFPYDGLMLHWSSRFVDLMVTPEHRMLVYQRQRERATATVAAGDWGPPYNNINPESRIGELRFVSAFDAARHGEIWIKKDAIWEGEEPTKFVLPAPGRSKFGRPSHDHATEIEIEDYLRFMGWFLSEGSTDCYGGRHAVALTQKDDDVRAELGDLLARITGSKPRHKRIQVVVDSKPLCEYVKQFGHSWEKFVPPNIKAMSPRLIRIFLDALFNGDGSIRDGRWTAYYTSSRQLWDDVQELLLKTGLSFSAWKREGGSDAGEVNGVRIRSRRDIYELSVNHDNLRPRIIGEPQVVAYKGTVWDLSVPPNGTLFIRRRGKVAWSGNCTVHGFWREDTKGSWFEATAPEGAAPFKAPMPGSLDCFVGNPWDTIFDPGARRGSWRWMSYLRVLPADAVRKFFDHIPQTRSIEGTTRISATSEFQRIARNWLTGSLGVHGRPLIERDRVGSKEEETITLLFREEAPTSHDDPGSLYIVGLPGYADRRDGNDGATKPVLLGKQALPGGDYSASVFYSDERGTDVHGKPWAEPLDQLQVDLNLTLSYEWEHGRKQAEAPIVAPGGAFHDDMMELGGYNVVEVEPSLANWRPRVMEWPQSVLTWLQSKQNSLRSQLFTLGGYQAVSRGESPGTRTPYRAILALQQADRTIHGPVNMWFQRSAIEFARRMWMQFKTYGDIPWLLSVVGDEYGYLVDPYVDKTKLSDTPPRFRLVNSFGASPELLAQEVVQLAQTRGADGQPFLTTEEARRAYPYRLYFDQPGDPKAVQRRRARTVAAHAHVLASRYRQATGFDEDQLPPQWRQQAIEQIGQQLAFVGIVLPDEMGQGQVVEEGLDQRFQRLRDDDIEAHLAAYTEVTQDESADPLARACLRARQQSYFEWQQQMVMQAQQAQLQAQMQAQGGAHGGAPGQASELAAGRAAIVSNERQGPAAVAAAPGA